ncbi:MAG: MarR family transcriptional regulator [Verrucomicrobia bacterium]|nr:MarR family transcriptional regulator [Verrucomicrobiota bacterium]
MADGIDDELEELLGEVMAIAARLRRSVDVGRGSPGLSLPARTALKWLQGHSSLTVPQLARHRGTSRQNIQVLVDRLEGDFN